MKTYAFLLIIALWSVSCSGQEDKVIKEESKQAENKIEDPKGTWRVDKEFDENGNLIRYDSIYSWSSSKFDDIASLDKDSLMQSFKSRFFTNFSKFENERFENVFSQDSLFSNRFFNDDFFISPLGKEIMDIDKMRQQMIARQKQFLEKYQSEFVKPKDEN